MRGLRLAAILALVSIAHAAPAEPEGRPPLRPHVLFILADDVGLTDPAVYRRARGLPVHVETPRIDRLAAEGMLFLDAHQPTSLCAPARFATLTGSHPGRGEPSWNMRTPSAFDVGGSHRHHSVGETLQAAGYRTAFIGKEHLGGRALDAAGEPAEEAEAIDFGKTREIEVLRGDGTRETRVVNRPAGLVAHGFDYTFTVADGLARPPYVYWENDRFAPIDPERPADARSIRSYGIETLDRGNGPGKVHHWGPGDVDWDPVDVGRRLSDAAVGFIDAHLARHPDTPFLLVYSAVAIHGTASPPTDFDGDPEPLDLPIRGTTPSPKLDLLRSLDLQVGRLLDALERGGVARDTLVFFTSDNGGIPGSLAEKYLGHDSADTVAGAKDSPFEGGHQVPLLVRWGDRTRAGSRVAPGTRTRHLVSIPDWVATLHDLTGQALPPRQAMDSASLLPLLVAEDPDAVPPVRRYHLVDHRGVGVRYDQWDRKGRLRHRWHYYEGGDEPFTGRHMLFDLATDPGQQHDLLRGLPAEPTLRGLRGMARQRQRALLSLRVGLANYAHAHDGPDDLPTTPRVDYARPELRTPVPALR